MLVEFFDDKGIVPREFIPTGPRKWKNDWVLHYDNAPSNTAMAVQQFLAKIDIPIVPHPPYSPDFAQSDFWYNRTSVILQLLVDD
jgi:hypothetical protein